VRNLHVPASLMLGLWFATQVSLGLAGLGGVGDTGGVAYVAHVGGFIAGFVLALLLRPGRRRT
jgi:membrane associated rhomboid family serine protease